MKTVASSRQEKTLAVLLGGEEETLHTVLDRELSGSIIPQFPPLLLGRDSPSVAPVGCGGIVYKLQGNRVVGKAVIPVLGIVAILDLLVYVTIAVLIGAPIVGSLGFGLAPSEVAAIFLWSVCSNVASGPQRATR